MKWIWIIVLMISGFAVQAAETRESLIAQIELAGQNEFGNERHAVEVKDCQLTTYRWKLVEGEGWVLWTSFEFPMLLVDLIAEPGKDPPRYFLAVASDPPMALIFFRGKEGFEFTHEKPFLRVPKGDYEKSPRGDGTTHYLEKKSEGMIVQQGPEVEEKAHLFTTGYLRYARSYCAFIG